MDEIEILRRHGERMRAAGAPAINVTDRVLATVRQVDHRQVTVGTARALMFVAAASWLFALTCGYIAVQAWVAIDDPVTALVAPLVVAL